MDIYSTARRGQGDAHAARLMATGTVGQIMTGPMDDKSTLVV